MPPIGPSFEAEELWPAVRGARSKIEVVLVAVLHSIVADLRMAVEVVSLKVVMGKVAVEVVFLQVVAGRAAVEAVFLMVTAGNVVVAVGQLTLPESAAMVA